MILTLFVVACSLFYVVPLLRLFRFLCHCIVYRRLPPLMMGGRVYSFEEFVKISREC